MIEWKEQIHKNTSTVLDCNNQQVKEEITGKLENTLR